jgi:hypothetical protein
VSVTTTYAVTLKASIAGGCTDQVIKQITINEGPKTCSFKAEPDYASSFYGMKMESTDGSGNVLSQGGVTYTWVIESGGNKDGSSVKHDFKKDGVYQVTMVARVDATGCECSQTQLVTMNRTSAEELSTAGMTVYPNPNSGQFNIAISEAFGSELQIELMTLSGSVVKSMNVKGNGIIPFDAGMVADGMYIVRVHSGDKTATSRIAVRH